MGGGVKNACSVRAKCPGTVRTRLFTRGTPTWSGRILGKQAAAAWTGGDAQSRYFDSALCPLAQPLSSMPCWDDGQDGCCGRNAVACPSLRRTSAEGDADYARGGQAITSTVHGNGAHGNSRDTPVHRNADGQAGKTATVRVGNTNNGGNWEENNSGSWLGCRDSSAHHAGIRIPHVESSQDIAGTLPRHCGSTNSEKATPEQASARQPGKKIKDSMGIPIPLK
jgi:hypothetical protein